MIDMLFKFREPVSGLTHLAGAMAALAGLITLLIIGGKDTAKIVSILVYGISLVCMFSASSYYHLADANSPRIQTLRKLDHSAIFLLIAGTYTPFCVIAFTGFFHWGLLAIIWAIALGGIIVKIFYIKAPRWLNAMIYVIMGWLCISAAEQMAVNLQAIVIVWLIAGGVIYTLGAIIYATKMFNFVPGKFGFHEVWHIFVLLGATSHFISVMLLFTTQV